MTEPEIRFSEHLPERNLRRTAALLAACLVIVVGAAVTMGASPSAAPSTPGTSAVPEASGDPANPDLRPGKRDGDVRLGGRGPHGGIGLGAISIRAISGANVTLETEDGWTRTIAVTATTTVTKAGEAATAGDLAVGDQVRLKQIRATDGTVTVTAIDVVQPKVAGTVTAVAADSITITTRDGSSRTITTTNSTTYRLGKAAANRADVVVGSTIVASGTAGQGPSFTATNVTVRPPRVGGTVTAVSGSTITVQRRDGTSIAIEVGADTTIQIAGVAGAGFDDIAIGMRLVAVGRLNADGSLVATAVLAGDGRFHGGPRGDRDGQPSPPASPASSSTG